MIINNGQEAIGVYIGDTPIAEIYQGENLVWSATIREFNNKMIAYKTVDNEPSDFNFNLGNNPSNPIRSNKYYEDLDACVMVFKNAVTEIPRGSISAIPGITKIIHLPSTTEKIGDYFMYWGTDLTSIDLSGLSNVTSIGSNFLRNCPITSIDLSALTKVTSIGDYFLSSCTGLKSIDLSGLSNVTSIDKEFLNSCSGLTSIDLSPLSKVTSISNFFLEYCTGLTSIDLSGLSNVTSIGGWFLNGCSGLTSIDLSPLSKVTSISNEFLAGCRGITSLDFNGLSNVTSIGNDFLYTCYNLKSIDFNGLSNVTSVGTYFLERCDKLETITGTIRGINGPVALSTLANLTADSAMVIINGLSEETTNKTMQLHSNTYNSLTEEQIAVATAKGWSVVG